MSRYEPPNPIKQKEREDLIEKVKEITSEESKGGKREKSVEVDTDLSWDHEELKPFPKAPKDRLNESPKPPRVPKVPKARVNTEGTLKKEYPAFSWDSKEGKYSEPTNKENKDEKVVPPVKKQEPGIGKKMVRMMKDGTLKVLKILQIRKLQDGLRNKMSFWENIQKKSLREIRKKGIHQYLNQMALLKFCRSKEQPPILVMNNHPNI